MTSVQWSGVDDMAKRMQEYVKKVEFALVQVATYWKAVFEKYAKENAPWTDRSTAARTNLHGWVNQLSNDTVELYLSHGTGDQGTKQIPYSVALETMYGGKYAIIWPTIQAHLKHIEDMLKGIFG